MYVFCSVKLSLEEEHVRRWNRFLFLVVSMRCQDDVVWLGDSYGNGAAASSSPPLSSSGPVAHEPLAAPPSPVAATNIDQDVQVGSLVSSSGFTQV